MKTIFLVLFVGISINQLNAQQDVELYGFAERPGFIESSPDGKTMYAADYGHLKAWDIAEKKVILDVNLKEQLSIITHNGLEYKRIGGFGWPRFNSNPNELIFVGTYYENRSEKSKIGTVFFTYNVEIKTISQTVLPGVDELFSFSPHPTNPNLVAAIFMDNATFENYATLVDLKEAKVSHKLLIGKGSLAPLCMSYSNDGTLVFTGYGNSSYGGGFEVNDVATGKLIKRVALPTDQGKSFYEWKDFVVVSGHTNSYLISKSNWTIVHTFKNMEITDVNPEKGLAIGTFIKQGDRTKFDEIMVADIESKKVVVHKVTKSHDYKFLPESDKIYSPFFKHSYKPEEKTLEKPSVIIFELPN